MTPAHDPFEGTTFDSAPASERNLADLCTNSFLLIFYILEGKDPGQPDQLRKEIAVLFQELDKRGRQSGHSEEDLKATRYALCALMDETILNSRWPYKDQWADLPLQLEHFGEHMAGERFFQLLERIRRKGSRKADLLEVFIITLILGFQGKYKLQGGDELKMLIRDLVGELHGYRGGPPRWLSPHWRIPEEPSEPKGRAVPRWMWMTALAAIVTVALVYLVFRFWIGSSVSEAVARMVV